MARRRSRRRSRSRRGGFTDAEIAKEAGVEVADLTEDLRTAAITALEAKKAEAEEEGQAPPGDDREAKVQAAVKTAGGEC